MSRIRTPENIEIASLKKKQQTVFDPMTSGAGTAWEDRGTHGVVGAFIKTCIASMFGPATLMGKIRRPETTNDARGFLLGISAIWGISAAAHQGLSIWRQSKAPDVDEVIGMNVGILCGLALIGGAGGMFFLYKLYNMVYGRLISQEKGSVLMPEVLLYNVNVYALGPSILSLIPYVGPPVALLWIFINLVVAGNSRLRLRMPAAVIDALLSMLAVLAIAGATYAIVEVVILDKALDFSAIQKLTPTDTRSAPVTPPVAGPKY